MNEMAHLQNLMRSFRAEFRRKYCLHPDAPAECSHQIVSAHSIQRAMLTKHIARNGHVLQYRVEPVAGPLLKGLFVSPKSIGVNEATTFFGFCGKHDATLFRPLEDKQFDFEPNQIGLLGYRAVCREFYQKEAAIAADEAMRNYVAANPDIPGFPEKDFFYQLRKKFALNARKNLLRARNRFAELLEPDGKESLRYFAIHFADSPVYFASSAFLPEWDFNGEQLQDLRKLDDFHPICFSAWAKGSDSVVVFCWHKSADAICKPFIESLRESKPHRLANRILGMAFEYCDNIAFRHDWWDSIPHRDQQYLAKRVMSGVEDSSRTAKSLLDGGLRSLKSNVVAIHAIPDSRQGGVRSTSRKRCARSSMSGEQS